MIRIIKPILATSSILLVTLGVVLTLNARNFKRNHTTAAVFLSIPDWNDNIIRTSLEYKFGDKTFTTKEVMIDQNKTDIRSGGFVMIQVDSTNLATFKVLTAEEEHFYPSLHHYLLVLGGGVLFLITTIIINLLKMKPSSNKNYP